MFKILLKKQLFEIFRTWFYNPKTNKARSKLGTFGMVFIFAILMFAVVGGMFTFIAFATCGAMTIAGMQWLYFDIFALISVVFGLFGSVLNTYSGLYLAKDNDLILSMPISSSTIVASRLFSTYLMGTMYSSLVFLPSIIVFQIVDKFNIAALVGGIIMLLEISLIVWVLSCLLGFVVAKISLKLKNRSFVTVLASLIFIGLYYFVYFKAQIIINDIIANSVIYGAKIKGYAYILYIWGQNGTGNLLDIIICLAICVVLVAITWLILSKTFLKIATSTPNTRKNTTAIKSQKEKKLSQTLLSKEFSRFTSSANYMLNCGFGVLFIPVAGIAILIKGEALVTTFFENLNFISIIPVVIVGVACMLACMNNSAATSVSLEGKSLWVLQSLPIDSWQIIKAKIKMQLILTEIPMLFFCICISVALPLSVIDKVMCVILSLLYPVLSSLFNMLIGLKMPIMEWSNEIIPIKQSWGVGVAIFGGFGYTLLLVGGYIGLTLWLGNISTAYYLGTFVILTLAISALLYRWLKTKGAKIFSTL